MHLFGSVIVYHKRSTSTPLSPYNYIVGDSNSKRQTKTVARPTIESTPPFTEEYNSTNSATGGSHYSISGELKFCLLFNVM